MLTGHDVTFVMQTSLMSRADPFGTFFGSTGLGVRLQTGLKHNLYLT